MKKIELTYNPFTHERTFLVDGKSATLPKCWGESGTRELSEWCGDFFQALKDKFNDSEMEVRFKGILRDWEFLTDAREKYSTENPSDRIALIDAGCVNTTAKLGELRRLFDRMHSASPFPELKTPELKDLFDKTMSSEFEMAVVATMSSGKSTLINSMLGCELLPARNEATTATLAKIHDIDGMNGFKGTSYDVNHEELASCDPLTLDNMNTLNDNPKTSVIEIYGDVVGVESKDIKLVLTDTPGPNNSRTEEHKAHTYALMKADYKPMILYVLNGTQLETNDDNRLLKDVADDMKSGGRQSHERFLFVLNKADEFDPEKGESVQKKVEDVKKYLAKHGIKDARVFPAAALMAKVIRQHLNNQPLTEKEEDEILPKYKSFVRREWKHFSDFAPLSSTARRELNAALTDALEKDDNYRAALIYTGVPAIELAITEYLAKYALPAKLSEGVHSFKDKIDSLGVEAEETKRLEGNREAVEKLRENLDKLESALAKGEKADVVRAKIDGLSVKDVLSEKFEKISGKLLSAITNKTQKMQNTRLHADAAQAYVESLQETLPDMERKFRIDVQDALNKAFTAEAQDAIKTYQKYLEELTGALPYSTPPAAILGDVAGITLESTLEEYSRMEDVQVGSHKEKSGVGKVVGGGLGAAIGTGVAIALPGVGWFLGPVIAAAASGLGAAAGNAAEDEQDVADYESQKFVDLSRWLDEKLLPQIETAVESTRKAAFDWAKREEKKFKEYFKAKLAELDGVVKKKLAEKKKAIADQTALEKTIAENESRLAWLNEFKTDLEKVLAV